MLLVPINISNIIVICKYTVNIELTGCPTTRPPVIVNIEKIKITSFGFIIIILSFYANKFMPGTMKCAICQL